MRMLLAALVALALLGSAPSAQAQYCWDTVCAAGTPAADCWRAWCPPDTGVSAPTVYWYPPAAGRPGRAPGDLGARWFAELERNLAEQCRAYRGLGCP